MLAGKAHQAGLLNKTRFSKAKLHHNEAEMTCLATALELFSEDVHHLVLPNQKHDQEVQKGNWRYERLHHAERKTEEDSHRMVGHLRAEAHVLVLPQPSPRTSRGGKAGLDVVEE